jgi:hypothetical protein
MFKLSCIASASLVNIVVVDDMIDREPGINQIIIYLYLGLGTYFVPHHVLIVFVVQICKELIYLLNLYFIHCFCEPLLCRFIINCLGTFFLQITQVQTQTLDTHAHSPL